MNYVLLVGLVSATLSAQPSPGAGSIEGRVLNSLTRAPVRKTSVELTAAQIWLSAETDAEGRFQFTALPAGSYRLAAKRSGFLDRVVRRPNVLGQDEHVTDVEIRVLPLSAITGRVLDEDGDLVGGASVLVFKQVYEDGRKQWDRLGDNTTTNDSGEYRYSGLKPGGYLVQARMNRAPVNNRYGSAGNLPDKPMMVYVPAYYPNAPNEQAASPVDVAAGTEARGIDIHLFRSPLFHVRGKITGVSPISGTIVQVGLNPVDAKGGGVGGLSASPPDYTFDASVMSGQYTIFAIQGYSNAPAAYASDSIAVAGNVSGVVLSMGPPMDVTGRISLAESGSRANLQGVRVNLRWLRSDLRVPDVRSDALGKIVFPKPTPPGHYAARVDVKSIPDSSYVKNVKLGGQEVSADDFELMSSAEIEIVLSNKAGTITGSISSSDGKPFPNSRATLIPSASNSTPATQLADDNGHFKFTALCPGKYKLFAWEEVDDGAWQDPEFRRKYESHATEITVGPNETQNAQLRAITAEEMN